MSKSEIQVLDFEKICRLCLLEKRSMSAIFSKKKSDKKVPLPVRIMSCASLELYEGDGLPASICNKCLMSVNQSYAFREQCEQADTTLRQYAQRLNEANEEASTLKGLICKVENQEDDSSIKEPDNVTIKEEKETCSQEMDAEVEEQGKDEEADLMDDDQESSEDQKNEDEWKPDDNAESSEDSEESVKGEKEYDPDNPEDDLEGVPVWKLHTCDVCSMPFRLMTTFNAHRKIKHPDVDEYRCVYCDAPSFKKYADYRKHIVTHEGTRGGCSALVCYICGTEKKTRRALHKHIKNHDGPKLPCLFGCGQKFSSTFQREIHNRSKHTKEKPFVCEHCGKGFVALSYLRNHVISHTGERPFVCDICKKGFNRSWNLTQHKRIHSGDRPYKCSKCDMAFIQNFILKDHMKKCHSD